MLTLLFAMPVDKRTKAPLVLAAVWALGACTGQNPDVGADASASGGVRGDATPGGTGQGGGGSGGGAGGQGASGGAGLDLGTAGTVNPADAAVGGQIVPPDQGMADSDGDSLVDALDNCPAQPNREQADADGDGQGDVCDRCPQGGSDLDLDGDGVLACAGDCDDTDPRRYPGSVERCDAIDNNCDNNVDEGFTDLGSACSRGQGLCRHDGSFICADDGLTLRCSANDGEPLPEVCDDQDNDCDGAIDEGVANCCEPGERQVCGQNMGRCRVGEQVCGPGRIFGECDAIGPESEICNGEDDDCNGVDDDGVLNACGLCGAVPVEVCDGLDNDCDGSVDEDVRNACGECGAPPAEICDGLDNDCDGETDEGAGNACGECGPLPAEVCDGVDNDCDGQTDEGVLNECGGCGAVSAEVCDGIDNNCDGHIDEGLLNACDACGPLPAEICDGADNNCNGATDEGLLNACGACGPTPVEVCDGIDNNCNGSTDEGLVNACGACGPVPVELCDGLDNNCNGQTDEGLLNACGDCGPLPPEICDLLDNNCNGQVDEGLGPCGPVESCNNLDDDDDGQVDEDLQDICVVAIGESTPGPQSRGFGTSLVAAGDLNGDGFPDAVAGAPVLAAAGLSIRAVSGRDGAELWHVDGDGKLGTSLAVGRFFEGGGTYVASGGPEMASSRGGVGQVVFFDTAGALVTRFEASGGRHIGESLATGAFGGSAAIDDLAVGDWQFDNADGAPADADHGRVLVLEMTREDRPLVVLDARGDTPGRKLGERVHVVSGVFAGLPDALLTTMRRDADRSVVTLHPVTGAVTGELRAPEATSSTFGQTVVGGRFGAGSPLAIGAPRAVFNNTALSGVVFVTDVLGVVRQRLSAATVNAEQGLALGVLPRPGAAADALIMGGRSLGRVDLYDPALNRTVQATWMAAGTSIGRAVAVSAPLANGTRRLFVSEPSHRNARGRVLIYSVR